MTPGPTTSVDDRDVVHLGLVGFLAHLRERGPHLAEGGGQLTDRALELRLVVIWAARDDVSAAQSSRVRSTPLSSSSTWLLILSCAATSAASIASRCSFAANLSSRSCTTRLATTASES